MDNPINKPIHRPPWVRRYGWFRLYNDFIFHPKWKSIASKTGLDVCEVIAITVSLLTSANKGKPRGSISDFSCDETAANLGLQPSQVVLSYQAFEQCGWIDREYLSTWDDRQPDKEDPTAAERQKRYRANKRGEREKLPTSLPPKPQLVQTPAQPEYSQNAGAKRMRRYRSQRTARGLPGAFNASRYHQVLIERDGEQCIYCLSTKRLEVDHICPVSQGGTDDICNLGLACRPCNQRKGQLLPDEACMEIRIETARAAFASVLGVLGVRPDVRGGVRSFGERNQLVGSTNDLSRNVTPKTQTKILTSKEAQVTKLSTGQQVTWKDVQEAGYVPPKQRSLPLPPVPLNKKGVGR